MPFALWDLGVPILKQTNVYSLYENLAVSWRYHLDVMRRNAYIYIYVYIYISRFPEMGVTLNPPFQ